MLAVVSPQTIELPAGAVVRLPANCVSNGAIALCIRHLKQQLRSDA